jgi:hypothetical protein
MTLALSILPQRHSSWFCSSLGAGSDKSASNLAKWLCALIHQLFSAPGGKMCEYQLDAKTAASRKTRPYLPQRRHVTFCDARWQIDSRLDQPAQRIEQNKSNTVQTCESLLPATLLLWGRNSVLEDKSSLTVCNSDTLFNC